MAYPVFFKMSVPPLVDLADSVTFTPFSRYVVGIGEIIMAFFYYDNTNTKQGPISSAQLKDLANQGIITPQTDIETDDGRNGKAAQVKGLFPEVPVPPPQTPVPIRTRQNGVVKENVPAPPPLLAPAPIPVNLANSSTGISVNNPVPQSPVFPTAIQGKFCSACGNNVVATAAICPKCGSPIAGSGGAGQTSRLTYILLGIFLGGLGIHNFYAGRTGCGVAQLLITLLTGWLIIPLIAISIWALVEVCVIKTDGKGIPMS